MVLAVGLSAAAGCLDMMRLGFQGPVEFVIPALSTGDRAEYFRWDGGMHNFTVNGTAEGVDQAGFRRDCVAIVEDEPAKLAIGRCLDLQTGSALTNWIAAPGYGSMGQVIEPNSAVPGGLSSFAPLLLQGQTLTLGKDRWTSFNGARLVFSPKSFERGHLNVSISLVGFQLDVGAMPDPQWLVKTISYWATYSSSSPFPIAVYTAQEGSPVLLRALRSDPMRGHSPLQPFKLESRFRECQECRTSSPAQLPPIDVGGPPWSLEAAFQAAGQDPAVGVFIAAETAVIFQARYETVVEFVEIAGPLGSNEFWDQWSLVALDWERGEMLKFVAARNKETGETRVDESGPTAFGFHLPPAFWPASFFDLENAWSAIVKDIPEAKITVIDYNANLDSDFFSPDPFVFVSDNETREGIWPGVFSATIEFEANGSGYMRTFSLVNGQWLFIAGPS